MKIPKCYKFLIIGSLIWFFVFLTISIFGQNYGISVGISNDNGKAYVVSVSDIKDGTGAYLALYRYSFTPYHSSICNKIDNPSLSDSIIANNYNGLSIGITYRLTKSTAKYPCYLLAGAGNVDRVTLHRQYSYQDFSVNYYKTVKKIISPEIGVSAMIYNSTYFQAGLQMAYKAFVGLSGAFCCSVKIN